MCIYVKNHATKYTNLYMCEWQEIHKDTNIQSTDTNIQTKAHI